MPQLPKTENNIDVTVVVSGQPERIRVNTHQAVKQLVHEALQRSGNKGQPPEQWELRTEEGVLINQGQAISASGIVDGVTLFLNPQAGAGG